MQNTVYLITGTSSGIGKALAEQIVTHSHVVGVARNCSLTHKNYKHYTLDLASFNEQNLEEINQLIQEYKNIHIIHNAGMIDPIAPISKLDINVFKKNHKVNFLAPVHITNHLLGKLETKVKSITFIGSGAARHTIDAWSAYCSAKAALLMFAKCLQQEYNDRNIPLKVFDISPGVIDTPMQEKIRNADQNLFLQKNRFDTLHKNNELSDPVEVARKIDAIIKDYDTLQNLEVNLREYPLPDTQ